MKDWDVIVVGSGAGGLSAAVALANTGKRVLVLEQHYIAGGWTQSFVLEGYRFSPGVHYLGEMEPGGNFARILQGLGVSGDLELCQLNEDGYDHFLVGGERFDVPVGRERFMRRLQARFPEERDAIADYFKLVRQVASELETALDYAEGWRLLLLPLKAPHLVFRGIQMVSTYLDRHIKSPLLRAYLTAQAGDNGTPPNQTPFALHAAVVGHYFNGGYYPRGGAHRLPRAFIRQLKRKGGQIRLSTPVQRILLEGGRVTGVELADGERISAPVVISNADPEMTFNRLVGAEHLSPGLRRKMARTDYGVTSLSLFLATDLDLRGMGYDSGNYWYYAHTDIDAIYGREARTLPAKEFPGAFLTVTTLKDPSKRRDGKHTLEVFSFVPYEAFRKWERTSFGDRGAEYNAFKNHLGDMLLRTADRIIPGLSDNLVFKDIGTPLSNLHYCASHRGNIYGPAKIRRQLGPGSYPVRSEIPGLYMVGASTLSHGVLGVIMSGLVAAAQIQRCPLNHVLSERGPELVLYPAERPQEWLEDLTSRRNRRAQHVEVAEAAA
jgi:phytoene dehydrogenase-like protein